VSAEDLGADGPTVGRGKRSRHTIERYGTALWLLALAILFGVLAYVIYPKDAPIPRMRPPLPRMPSKGLPSSPISHRPASQ
jgi:hypothetical protein